MKRKEKLSRRHFSEEFKLSVLQDYYSSGLSKNACTRKYGLRSIATICRWLHQYESQIKSVSLPSEQEHEEMSNRSKEDYKDENARLKRRIRELEKALEFSRLETMARDLLIDKAEEYFDIPIRKKPGAK